MPLASEDVENIHAGYDRTEHIMCSHKPAREPMLTLVHCLKYLQWACEHLEWSTGQWKKVAWSDEIHLVYIMWTTKVCASSQSKKAFVISAMCTVHSKMNVKVTI